MGNSQLSKHRAFSGFVNVSRPPEYFTTWDTVLTRPNKVETAVHVCSSIMSLPKSLFRKWKERSWVLISWQGWTRHLQHLRQKYSWTDSELSTAMEFIQLLLFLLPVWACITEVDGKESFASVLFDSDGQLVIKTGYDSSQPMVAWGKFRDEINSTG